LVTWAEALLGVVLIWLFAEQGIIAVAIIFSARFYLLWPVRFAIARPLGGGTISTFLTRMIIAGALTFGLLTTFLMKDRMGTAIRLAKGQGAP